MELKQLNDTLQKLGETWEEYKRVNDDRLAQIEKDGAAAHDTVQKLMTLEDQMKSLEETRDRLEKVEIKLDTPTTDESELDRAQAEHVKKFETWLRSHKADGNGWDAQAEGELREVEIKMRNSEDEMIRKAVSIGTAAAGGHALPEVISRRVWEKILDRSAILPLVSNQTVGTSDYKELVDVLGTSGGWVGETDTRSETNTPQLAQVAPTFGIVYAYPKATEESLQDIFFDVTNWLERSVSRELERLIGVAIISGDGSNKPTGFLNGTPVAIADDDSLSPLRAFGTLQYIPSGVASSLGNDATGSPAATGPDAFIDTVYALKAGYRMNARWLMNKATLGTVRKWKDVDFNYIWQPGLTMGQPSTVLGYPVAEMEDMPDVGANTFPVAFGDFEEGYLFCRRAGMSMTVDDNITTPGYVKFYIRQRVGGILRNDDCIKVVKCAAA